MSQIPTTMMAIVAPTPGGPEALTKVERPVPKPAYGEVLIRVAAAGLNGADLSQRRGRYEMPPGATDILGLEASGTVVATGDGVTQWKTGDQVCALLVGGGYAEYVAAPAVQCLPVPRGVSLVESAALPEVTITVWLNVFELAGLRPGDKLLVHGGASGIGSMAIQLAHTLGSRVYATAGSPEKCARCEALGAVRAINYRTEDFVAVIGQETGGAGVDVILEMIGGDYLQRGMSVLAFGGRLAIIALKNGAKMEFDFSVFQRRDAKMIGSRLRPRPIPEKARLVAAVRRAVWPLIEDGRVKPVVDRMFRLADAPQAHTYMESGAHIGKILLTP
ncbi:MAG TPA: NAD(P)H-quinone oxidoreductase [Xanthobacteraceae bacterium]